MTNTLVGTWSLPPRLINCFLINFSIRSEDDVINVNNTLYFTLQPHTPKPCKHLLFLNMAQNRPLLFSSFSQFNDKFCAKFGFESIDRVIGI